MSILKTIGTFLPTIGTVLGKLLTGETANKAVVYNFGDGITCGFKENASGEISLINSSMDDDKVITFAVPANGDSEAETIIVPSEHSAPVSEVFQRCTAADSTKCMLSGSSALPSADAVKGGNDVFHFSAGGRNIIVDGVTSKRIGSFLTVVCHRDKAVFSSKRTIKTITSATFYGFNDSSVTITNVDAVADGTGTKAEIFFPTPFPDGTYLEVDVEVDMGDRTLLVKEQRIPVVKADEKDLTMIRKKALSIRG